MEVHCQHCNAPNRSEAMFCDQCGEPLTLQIDPAASLNPGRPARMPEENPTPGAYAPSSSGAPFSALPGPGGVAWEAQTSTGSTKPDGLPEMPGHTIPPSGQPQDIPASFRPQWAAKGNKVIGEAHEYRPRSEGTAFTVWSFRVDRYDKSGNRLPPVPVEMKGLQFDGSLSEGDWVEVPGAWKPGEVMKPTRFNNLTTGATIKSKTPFLFKISQVIAFVIALVVIAIFIGIAIFIIASFTH
jgi:hypothetical protein